MASLADGHKAVEVWLDLTVHPLRFVASAMYQKGDFYCIRAEDGRVHKFPLAHIFRVVEDY